MQCSRCGFENVNASAYCEQCGTLQNATEIALDQAEYKASPPPPLNGHAVLSPPSPPEEYGLHPPRPAYDAPPPSPFGYDMSPLDMYTDQKIAEARPAVTFFRVIRAIVYFMAVFVTGFGLFSAFISFGGNQLTGDLGLFFWLGLILGSIVIFVRLRHRVQRLRWLPWLLWLVCATIGTFMAFALVFALVPGQTENPVGAFFIGVIIALYGLAVAVICMW
jgi:hypothetical protein